MSKTAELHAQAAVWAERGWRFATLYLEGEAPDKATGGQLRTDALLQAVRARGLPLTTDPEQVSLLAVNGWRIGLERSGGITLEWPHFTPTAGGHTRPATRRLAGCGDKARDRPGVRGHPAGPAPARRRRAGPPRERPATGRRGRMPLRRGSGIHRLRQGRAAGRHPWPAAPRRATPASHSSTSPPTRPALVDQEDQPPYDRLTSALPTAPSRHGSYKAMTPTLKWRAVRNSSADTSEWPMTEYPSKLSQEEPTCPHQAATMPSPAWIGARCSPARSGEPSG